MGKSAVKPRMRNIQRLSYRQGGVRHKSMVLEMGGAKR